jgi:hypothetical protein
MQMLEGGSSFVYEDNAEQLRPGEEVTHTDANTLIRV